DLLVAPNILTTSGSVAVLDVKGDLLKKYGNAMKERGYQIKVLDLISNNFDESNCFNPFVYITSEVELIRLVMTLQKSMTQKVEHSGDPFWEDGVTLFLMSCFYYIWLEDENPNLVKVYDLICDESKIARINKKEVITVLQEKMESLEIDLNEKYPNQNKGSNHPAVVNYKKLKEGATDTVKSIILMCHSKFKFMEVEAAKSIFSSKDEFHLEFLGTGYYRDKKTRTIVFLCIPDEDRSFDFIIAMFYSVLFQTLIREAKKYEGSLPIPVEIWMDEFANGARPDNFEKLITTLRSRNISVIMFLQAVSQLKQLYKNDTWEILLDACTVMLFLGAGRSAVSTHEYISKLLSKATIDKKNDSLSNNKGKGTSMGFDKMGRELMTPDEVARMNKEKCLVFIEGEAPIYDFKFKTKKMLEWKNAMKLGRYIHPIITTKETGNYKNYGKITRKEEIKEVVYLESEQINELREKSGMEIKDRREINPCFYLLDDYLEDTDKELLRGSQNERYMENEQKSYADKKEITGYVYSEEELLYFEEEEMKKKKEEAMQKLLYGKESVLKQIFSVSSLLFEWQTKLIKKALEEELSDAVIRYILKENTIEKEALDCLDYMILYKKSGGNVEDLIQE
ncbi:MAG TPA: type IV secretory system conjugative DNA transfer family protein, partial [Lachnospiraceae bacterium]